jgi:hypothetical protein
MPPVTVTPGRYSFDLGGDEHPLPPSEALLALLRYMGANADDTRPDRHALRAAYPRLTGRFRMAFVLDRAISASQVRPLVPAAPSALVVACGHRLSGLANVEAQFSEVD